ncbi:MAG: hypothetical protein QXT25_03200 [Candidatus Anstonellaceae archaeon]
MISDELFSKAELAIATIAAAVGILGLILSAVGYLLFFLFVQQIENAAKSQIDSLAVQLEDARQLANQAAASTERISMIVIGLGEGVSHYSTATKNLSDSMSDIAKVPPFSLDARFGSAVSNLKSASLALSKAAVAANESSASIINTAATLNKTASDLGNAKNSLMEAKKQLKEAFGMLNLAALAAFFALALVFFSVILLSALKIAKQYVRKKN